MPTLEAPSQYLEPNVKATFKKLRFVYAKRSLLQGGLTLVCAVHFKFVAPLTQNTYFWEGPAIATDATAATATVTASHSRQPQPQPASAAASHSHHHS